MGRLLFLALVVVAIVWLLKRAFRDEAAPSEAQGARGPARELIACARCGLNLPREEARESAGALFCSEEHARLGARG